MSLTQILLVPIAVARVVANFILCENGDYLVQQDGGKLILED